MHNVQQLLEQHFGKKGWIIERPKDGWETSSYIATLHNEKYFIKFNINPQIMLRLSDLKVTAPVIKVGIIEGENYMIQEFINGSYVPKEWFENNLERLAKFILKYHNDDDLKNILSSTADKNYLSIAAEIKTLSNQLDTYSVDEKYADVREGINELKTRYQKFSAVKLVPTHDDPNTKNIFLVHEDLYMVDWNKMRLSDPISDIGAMLWWYVASAKWPMFFDSYGMELTEEVHERIYLAAAKMSMGFTLWFVTHNKDHKAAFNDFTAALNQKPNPRAWYL